MPTLKTNLHLWKSAEVGQQGTSSRHHCSRLHRHPALGPLHYFTSPSTIGVDFRGTRGVDCLDPPKESTAFVIASVTLEGSVLASQTVCKRTSWPLLSVEPSFATVNHNDGGRPFEDQDRFCRRMMLLPLTFDTEARRRACRRPIHQ